MPSSKIPVSTKVMKEREEKPSWFFVFFVEI